MKKTVRLFCVLLAIFTLLSFAACSAHDPEEAPSDAMNNAFPSYGDGLVPGGAEEKADGPIFDAEVNIPNSTGDSADEYPPEEGTYEWDDEAETKDTEESEVLPDSSAGEGIDLILNPFVRVEENRFSTFSADVDTASYTYFRKLVSMEYSFSDLRNSGSAFRTEEFINYFRYDVPSAREGELFGVYSELTPCPWTNGDTMLLRLTLEAPEAQESAGNNLVFLIDVSGSMSSQDKLPLLKKAFSYLVGNLSAKDTISIVTYSGREAIVLDGCRGSNTSEIMSAINDLTASGSTNGEAGLTMAYQIAEKHMIEGGNNRIIMASDGDLNVGISSSSELTAYIEEKRDQGVYLSVLGFGTGNYRDDKMEALADNGNGVYYYIDGESEAEKVFGTDLAGTLYTVANDVKLQIEFDQEMVDSYRLIGYDNRVLDKEDFEDDTKDAGEVGAGHQVTVVYEITIKTTDLDTGIDTEQNPINYMTLRVRYKNPGETLSKLNEYKIGTKDIKEKPTAETSFIISVVELASLLRNPEYQGNVTIDTIKNNLKALTLTDSYMTEFRGIVEKLAK